MDELIKNFEKIKVRLFKFLLVGGICTIINYIIFYVLYKYYGINYIVSSATGYIIGLIIGYYINKFWTYEVS
ncbi:MAG: GtrA family protein, partial [Leptospiraceae bacterium]|nr:GtrA family protein [Leptospiraceae bacterium]